MFVIQLRRSKTIDVKKIPRNVYTNSSIGTIETNSQLFTGLAPNLQSTGTPEERCLQIASNSHLVPEPWKLTPSCLLDWHPIPRELHPPDHGCQFHWSYWSRFSIVTFELGDTACTMPLPLFYTAFLVLRCNSVGHNMSPPSSAAASLSL